MRRPTQRIIPFVAGMTALLVLAACGESATTNTTAATASDTSSGADSALDVAGADDIGTPACSQDSDCAATDSVANSDCERKTCHQGKCVTAAAGQGAACDTDGLWCTEERCEGQTCVFLGLATDSCGIAEAETKTCAKAGQAAPSSPCLLCDPAKSQTSWSPMQAGSLCGSALVGCVEQRCNSAGACEKEPNDSLCAVKGGSCTAGACDESFGCKTVPLPTTATCTGEDGLSCTVEYCDGQGACAPKQNPDDTACNDGLSCTVDSCDPTAGTVNSGCVHKQVDAACDDGNLCTADTCAGANGEAGSGCSYIPNAADCTTDGLACTTEQCKDGACKLTVDAKNCVIDGACVAEGTKQQQGCQSCTPSASQSAWTLASAGATCDDDGASCTKDTCSAAGACKHETIAGACDDGLPCTVDACDPGTAWADSKTGCAFVDDCPYGHSCDATAKVCLTPEPVVLVPASADDPAPTNPVALRHVLDAKTGRHRLWVVYQSQAAADGSGGDWSIKNVSKLRAVVLDPAVAAKPGAAKPKPKTVTFANTVTGINAAAAFAAVAADPESSSQGWLTWLEAGVGNTPVCLDNFGRGGIARVARLDGAAVPANGTWTAVAGTTCPLDAGDKPGFMTPGFAVLGGAQTDPAKRGVVLARPFVTDLKSPGLNQLVAGGVAGSANSKGVTVLGEFSTVRPTIVDMGAEDGNKARFWLLAFGEEKSGANWNRELWALSLDASGAKKQTTKWLDSGATGVGTTILGGTSEVCAMDAAWDADAGEAVVVIVTRQAGQDRVWLAHGKPGGTWKSVDVTNKKSAGGCHQGLTAARLTVGKSQRYVVVQQSPALAPQTGFATLYGVTDSGSKELYTYTPTLITDTGVAAGPGNALASRGLAAVVDNGNGTITLVVEGGSQAGKHEIVLHTFKP